MEVRLEDEVGGCGWRMRVRLEDEGEVGG